MITTQTTENPGNMNDLKQEFSKLYEEYVQNNKALTDLIDKNTKVRTRLMEIENTLSSSGIKIKITPEENK